MASNSEVSLFSSAFKDNAWDFNTIGSLIKSFVKIKSPDDNLNFSILLNT